MPLIHTLIAPGDIADPALRDGITQLIADLIRHAAASPVLAA